MVEYGNGVSQVAGKATGGSSGGAQNVDMGASVSHFVTNSMHTISTMPPAYLVVGVVILFLGLIILRRAF
jgi:hypothetical protein